MVGKAGFEEAMQGSGNFDVLNRFLEFGQSNVNDFLLLDAAGFGS